MRVAKTSMRRSRSRAALAAWLGAAGLLEAVAYARTQMNPMAMIRGFAEIGKMLGLYAPEVKRVEVSADGQVEMDRLARLSDAELLKMVAAGQAEPAVP